MLDLNYGLLIDFKMYKDDKTMQAQGSTLNMVTSKKDKKRLSRTILSFYKFADWYLLTGEKNKLKSYRKSFIQKLTQ